MRPLPGLGINLTEALIPDIKTLIPPKKTETGAQDVETIAGQQAEVVSEVQVVSEVL